MKEHRDSAKKGYEKEAIRLPHLPGTTKSSVAPLFTFSEAQ
jgi:hypothetical protein